MAPIVGNKQTTIYQYGSVYERCGPATSHWSSVTAAPSGAEGNRPGGAPGRGLLGHLHRPLGGQQRAQQRLLPPPPAIHCSLPVVHRLPEGLRLRFTLSTPYIKV